MQIRGIHGEHSESTDATYDISNKRRLGRSEKDLVQDMYDGVKAMIDAEKALAEWSSSLNDRSVVKTIFVDEVWHQLAIRIIQVGEHYTSKTDQNFVPTWYFQME